MGCHTGRTSDSGGPLALKLISVTSNEVCPGRQKSGPELSRLSKGSRNIQSRLVGGEHGNPCGACSGSGESETMGR